MGGGDFNRKLEAWRLAAADLQESRTSSGIQRPALCTPGDAPDVEPEIPGEWPFTRGIHPTMYRGRLWTMRQYAGFSTPGETNRRFRALLDSGQTGLSVAFDLPTQIGYDPDHELAEGEVGKVGVSISCLEDMEELLEGIPLDQVSTSMTINSTAIVLLALYVAVGRRQGVPPAELAGTIQNDILKEYSARGTYRYPARPSLRIITDVFSWCAENTPRFNTISISGYHMREAGCTAAQEVAFTLANGIAYVQAALDAGLDVDHFARRLSFFFNAHNDLFEEVAKFRAARRLWARIMRERFGAVDDRSCALRFHVQTAGSTLASRQSDNNVVRVTLQALAAVLGGTQSLHTNGRDEALGLPTEASAMLALRTQQVIAFESGVSSSADPLGGSWYVEHLTSEVERAASDYLDQIDEMGGAVNAIEKGFIQREIHQSACEAQKRVDDGTDVVVGVNRFAQEEGETPPTFFVDETAYKSQCARLEKLRAGRDNEAVERLLDDLRAAAQGSDNLFPHVLACVEGDVTLGEICGTLEGEFGRYREVPVL